MDDNIINLIDEEEVKLKLIGKINKLESQIKKLTEENYVCSLN